MECVWRLEDDLLAGEQNEEVKENVRENIGWVAFLGEDEGLCLRVAVGTRLVPRRHAAREGCRGRGGC